jgi:hypothetical protein
MAGEVMPTVGGFDASKMGPIIMPAQGAMPAGSGGPYSGMFADGGLQNIMDHMPGYKSIMNGSGGTLGAPYSVGQAFDPTKIPGFYDKTNSSINDLSSMAHQGGLTQLGQMQDQQLSGSALRSAQSAGNQNLDRLAVQGGVSSGAGERMASSNMVNQANQVNAAHTNVSMNDAQFKQNILGQLPSMYGQVAQSEQQGALQAAQLNSTNDRFNAQNAIADNFNQNNWGMQGWQTGASVYGNQKLADAQAAAANKEDPGLLGSGGFLGTGIGGRKGLLGTGIFSSNGVVDTSHWMGG